jgi:hypothetical protein
LSRLRLVRRSHLTACAGIVFCRVNYPFRQAYRFCEELCRAAKEQLKRTASGLLFARVTNALTGNYDAWVGRELTVGDDFLSLGAYTTSGGYPNLEHLLKLKTAMEDLPGGGFRTYIEGLHHAPERAERQFQNWLKRVQSTPAHEQVWEQFASALEALTQRSSDRRSDELPCWWTSADAGRQTPLRDALELIAVEPESQEPAGELQTT